MASTTLRGARALLLTLAALALPQEVRAQTLSWFDAVGRAERTSPRVLAEGRRVEEAQRGEDVATMFPNPSLSVGSYVESSRLYMALLVPMPIWGSVGMAGDVARARTGEADASRRGVRVDAGVNALLAWVDVWACHAQLRVAEASTQRLGRLSEAVHLLVTQGQRPRLDAVVADGELANARAEEAAAGRALDAARALLAAAVGAQDGTSPDTEGDPPGEETTSLSEALAGAANNPAVDVLQHREATARAEEALERRLRIPTPALQVWAYLLRVSNPAADVYVGLNFELPVFNQRGALIERARAREATARADAEAAEAQLRAQARAAWALHEAARERARAQVTEVLPAANEAADLAQEAYRAGRLDLTGLLAVEQRRLAAQMRADAAVADRARTLAALRRVMGGGR